MRGDDDFWNLEILTQQSCEVPRSGGIRAFDNKFSLLKAQKIYYKALRLFLIGVFPLFNREYLDYTIFLVDEIKNAESANPISPSLRIVAS